MGLSAVGTSGTINQPSTSLSISTYSSPFSPNKLPGFADVVERHALNGQTCFSRGPTLKCAKRKACSWGQQQLLLARLGTV